MNNTSNPNSPRTNVNTPSRDRTPSSNGLPVIHYSKPIRTIGERLASLVGASLTTVGDVIYVFGGFDQYSDEIYNKLYKLDYKNSCQWTQVIYTKGEPPEKRNDHSATLWNGDKLVIFGGNSEEDIHFNDVAVLDLNSMTWWHPKVNGYIPEGRIRHSASIFRDKLYIAGGINVGSTSTFADSLLILDLTSWEWEQPIPFISRAQHISFIYESRLYIYGGLLEDMSRSNQLAFIDLNTTHHTSLIDITSPFVPSLSGQRFAQICGDQLVVLVTLPFREALMENPVTGVWVLDLPSMQWKCKELGSRYESCSWHCFSMTENDSYFYLFGTNDDDEPDEFYAMVLRVELEELGIVAIPPPQLGNELMNMLINQHQNQATDFSIKSSKEPDATPIFVHRLILLARWPYFVNLMGSGMAESISNTITMSESIDTLKGFIRYLYTDTLDNDYDDNTDLIADLMVMAHIYLLPRLLTLCVRRLFDTMDIESASKIYHSASLSEQRGLQQASLHYIFQHFGAISHTIGFRQLPRPILFQIWDDMPTNAAIVGQQIQQMQQNHNIDVNNEEEEEEEEEEEDEDMEA